MIRIADSFVVLPHALLRSLFFPSINPRLQASITPVWDLLGDLSAAIDVSFEIRIRNTGNATANDVLAIVYGSSSSWAFGGEFRSTQTEYGYGASIGRPIHPKCEVMVGKFKARVPVYYSPNVKLQKQAYQQMPFEATIELFARDMAATVQKTKLTAEEIEARSRSTPRSRSASELGKNRETTIKRDEQYSALVIRDQFDRYGDGYMNKLLTALEVLLYVAGCGSRSSASNAELPAL